MSKKPYRYRTLRWRWIILYMIVVWLVSTLLIYAWWPGAFFWVMFATASGWQMGVVSERNEWREWYDKHGEQQP